MTTTELITPPRAPSPPEPWSDAPRNARPATSAYPTFGEMLDETVPLIGVIPVAGPPVVLVAGPWLLFGLMLAGPFAVLFTLVVLFVAVAAVVGLIGAILAAPYLLVRHVRGYRAAHASARAPAAQADAVESERHRKLAPMGGGRWRARPGQVIAGIGRVGADVVCRPAA
jgi:hypothetical protein